jgi:hypothetical protein
MSTAMRPIYIPETMYALIEQRAQEENKSIQDEVLALFEQAALRERQAFMRLPLADRRRVMAEQAQKIAKHYEQTTAERELWQGGDIVDN